MDKLLIIDDNVEIAEMLNEYMGFAGFEVTVENDGKNGLKLIESGDFDKVILDMAMPEFSGLDILESLKTRNFRDFKKINILSATVMDDKICSKINSYGVNQVIEKPTSMSNLLKKIQGDLIKDEITN